MERKIVLVGVMFVLTALMILSQFTAVSNAIIQQNTAIHPPEGHSTRDSPPAYSYNRQAAYGYAKKWATGRNPNYNDFSSMGGDCADFVSQCLIAGGLSLHKGTDGKGYGVYPDSDRPNLKSYGTIPFCDYLHQHLVKYQGAEATYITNDNPYVPGNIQIGDVVIFGDKNGDKYKHAMIVVGRDGDDVLLAAHSSDVWGRTFTKEMSYFSCATFYHIPVHEAGYYHFRVTAGTLNVRAGPGKNAMGQYYQDIGDIHQGEEYIAFEYVIDSEGQKWWHFWFGDRSAWCAAAYTQEITDEDSNGKLVFEVNVNSYLNVRSGPSTSSTIIGQVFSGMRFVAYAKEGDWYKFYYRGQTAYCHSGYTNTIAGKITVNTGGSSGGGVPYGNGGPLKGIDVSHWQGTVNWDKVKQDGVVFAYVKATEGVSYKDSKFDYNMQNAKAAGIYVGAYHFARPDKYSAKAEAAHFASVIAPYIQSGYLRPALDLEVGSSLGKTKLTQWVHDFMNEMIARTGVVPIIYVNANYASNYLSPSVTKYDLWIAHYTSASKPKTGVWTEWAIWQYTDKGSVNGISGHNVDMDKFNGDLATLQANLVIGGGGATPQANSPPVVDMGGDQTVKVGETVYFDASGSYDTDGEITKYVWNFGDGTSAEGPKVSHVYHAAGTYTVTLTVTDNNGATTTKHCTVTVEANQPPVASAGPDRTVVVGTPVSLSAAGSSDPDGTIVSYSWNLGDGTTASGISVSHTYSQPGTYTVTLTVTDNDGATASDSCTITVVQQQTPSQQSPVADAGSDVSTLIGQAVQFDASGSYDPDGTIVSYTWDFGDGTTGTGQKVTHTYNQPGTYTVTLTVVDNDGHTSTDTIKVTVRNSPATTPGFGIELTAIALLGVMLILAYRRKDE